MRNCSTFMESYIYSAVCRYSLGGDGFRFNLDNLLHDVDGVLNSPVDIRLVSLPDHALYLLREHWTGISPSLGGTISDPSHHGEVMMLCVRLSSSSFDQFPKPPSARLASHLHC